MALDGSWNIRISTPMGTNKMTLDLVTDDTVVTGTAHTMGGDAPVENGVIEGDALTYTIKVKAPFPMQLDMVLTVDGDTVRGTSNTGAFPPAPVEGERAG